MTSSSKKGAIVASVFTVFVALILPPMTSNALTTSRTCPECPKGCVAASTSEQDGCPQCTCPRTCDDITCACDEECTLQEVQCFADPCDPQPKCLPKKEAGNCGAAPNRKICGETEERWFYNSSENACQPFKYGGCSPCPNTFRTIDDCSAKCVDSGPICPMIMCARGCITFKPRNQCSRCICPDPCQTVRCGYNTTCKLREGTCSSNSKACDPEVYCG